MSLTVQVSSKSVTSMEIPCCTDEPRRLSEKAKLWLNDEDVLLCMVFLRLAESEMRLMKPRTIIDSPKLYHDIISDKMLITCVTDPNQ